MIQFTPVCITLAITIIMVGPIPADTPGRLFPLTIEEMEV